MASIGHVAVAFAAARACARPTESTHRHVVTMLALSALSLAPDLDVIAFILRVPYGAPWGHRGATHSLAFAALGGLVIALGVGVLRRAGGGFLRRAPPARVGSVAALVLASHGVLDALTDGGRGVALLWPLSDERFFFPWRPLPVAPIGLGLFSGWGLRVLATEGLWFLPLFVYALWPRRRASVNAEGDPAARP